MQRSGSAGGAELVGEVLERGDGLVVDRGAVVLVVERMVVDLVRTALLVDAGGIEDEPLRVAERPQVHGVTSDSPQRLGVRPLGPVRVVRQAVRLISHRITPRARSLPVVPAEKAGGPLPPAASPPR